MTRIPGRKLKARVAGLYAATGEDFVSAAVERLELGFEGIAGDLHAGSTRRSGGREPWYPRGTLMRNERQLSILAPDELAAVASALGVPAVEPEWIGGNMLIEGIEALSWLPPRTLLFFAGGVTLRIDGDNGPCRSAGRAVARNFEGRDDIEFGFVQAAKHRRGLVGWVEKPGSVAVGETLTAMLPEQWIYSPAPAGALV
ncbi:MOSC domain-containing protein [Mangrovibrevibacter kandeliae]|uniref:MOSC domain-containing protein n=1 Tax=Mangrovibrevibacter kandeliae TaxID=2968473 RepID=UPI0021192650|nr:MULTISPECIES: molybdenum cofactor sulfurase [unclassified Aurantimonas]MCQ8783938.1 molybdenum cofactor sulfurase [Aurantimonas sp. CSK15Z-1]MCW4116656.1 molybdenum cofactor sulfurase [Aurantimonas sp. MSK8Z-1]